MNPERPPVGHHIEPIAKWLGIEKYTIPVQDLVTASNFGLIEFRDNKIENDTLVESGIGYTFSWSNAVHSRHNVYEDVKGVVKGWTVRRYNVVEERDLARVKAMCKEHPIRFGGMYDELTKSSKDLGDKFCPNPRYVPADHQPYYMGWKEKGASLDKDANFWAIRTLSCTTWIKADPNDEGKKVQSRTNWICTTNRKWAALSLDKDSKTTGLAEFGFPDNMSFWGYANTITYDEGYLPWFTGLKFYEIPFEGESAAEPIKGFHVYSNNFEREFNVFVRQNWTIPETPLNAVEVEPRMRAEEISESQTRIGAGYTEPSETES